MAEIADARTSPAGDRGQQMRTALQRYASALARHYDDELAEDPRRPE